MFRGVEEGSGPDGSDSGVSDDAGASVDDPLAAALDLVERVVGEDRSGWTGAARNDRLVQLLALAERARAAAALVAGEWDAAGDWAADGSLHGAQWLTRRGGLSRARSWGLVRSGQLAHQHERVGAALAAGALSSGHAEVLARAVTPERVELFRRDVEPLVEAGARLGVDRYAMVVRRWRELVDDTLSSADATARFERRRLHVWRNVDGMVAIDGLLDPDGGAAVLAAIDALDRPDPKHVRDGPRTLVQRRADALVELSRQWMGQRNDQAGAPVATIDVHVDAETLFAAREVARDGRRSATRDDSSGSGTSNDLLESVGTTGSPGEQRWLARVLSGRARCDVEGVGSVPAETARRLLCDSWASRVVLSGPSEVLDVGRRTRFFTGPQRRALVARADGCEFPGCDAPRSWCDAHHGEAFAQGGSTDLDHAYLLCRRHHVAVHEAGWQLIRQADGTVDARPPPRHRAA